MNVSNRFDRCEHALGCGFVGGGTITYGDTDGDGYGVSWSCYVMKPAGSGVGQPHDAGDPFSAEDEYNVEGPAADCSFLIVPGSDLRSAVIAANIFGGRDVPRHG